MWIADLFKAVKAVKEAKGEDLVFQDAKPCWDGGIVFHTTHHTYIKWYPNGKITERGEDEWRIK